MSNPAEDRKFEAEADAALALADFHRANAALANSTARKNEAEARLFAAEEQGRRAAVRVAELTARLTEQEDALTSASDAENNVYRFTGAVTDETVAKAMKTITAWSRLDNTAPISIYFYSPGGSVTAGLALWDFIQEIKAAGNPVTTIVSGMAASMAGILLQAGTTRVMGKESWLMIHEVSFGAQGKIGEIEDTVEWVKMVQVRVKAIFAERSDLTVDQLEDMWRRKDCWISSEKALELGLVDEVR